MFSSVFARGENMTMKLYNISSKFALIVFLLYTSDSNKMRAFSNELRVTDDA